MSKDKDKDKKKGRSKGKSGDSPSKKELKRARSAESEIAAAEQRLASALKTVDEAREELAAREQELRHLLQKHGRLPKNIESDAAADGDNQDEDAVNDAAVSSGSTTAETAEPESSVEVNRETSADGSAGSEGPATVPLFDQRQVVSTSASGGPEESGG